MRTDSDFTEDAVSIAIASLLASLNFLDLNFSIEPFSRSEERWLGADAHLYSERIRGFRPFYMQFKRPSAYLDSSKAGIISDRRCLNLLVSPRSLFFRLRDKKKNQKSYQHNVLFRLRHRLIKYRLGDAAYVCPLFLDRSAYYHHVHLAGRRRRWRFWRPAPWELEDLLINHSGRTIRFERIPILKEHISIPPHAEVKSSNHSYSFTEAGSEVCFHSPISLPEEPNNLAQFLRMIGRDFLGEKGKITRETAFQHLSSLLEIEDGEEPISSLRSKINRDDPIGSWLFWGDALRRNYGIEQYAFVRWKDR